MHGKQNGLRQAHQRGLSLVELMIALALGAALIAGIFQIFTSNNDAFRLQQNMSRMQESSRFAFHFLSTELRQAGYAGCAGGANHESVIDTSDSGEEKYEYMFQFSKAVEGYDLAQESLPTSGIPTLSPAPKAGSEVIVIRRAGTGTLTAAEDQPNSQAASFKTAELHEFEPGDILTISDCQSAYTFQVTNSNQNNKTLVANSGTGSPGNATKLTKSQFGPDWSISRSYAIFYYLVDASNSASGQPALYRKINDKNAQELVAGVEDIEYEYGLDTDIKFSDPTDPKCPIEKPGGKGDGDVDEFKNAADIDDTNCEWAEVIGVRLSILVRSRSDDVMTDEQTLMFNGSEITRDDGYMRHAVNSTLTFRNKTR